MSKILPLRNNIQEVIKLEEKTLSNLDEVAAHRWLKEAKTDFNRYQEQYRETGSRQDKFDLLIKYLEVAAWQAKKRNMTKSTK